MPALTVNGTTIPVAVDGFSTDRIPVGTESRSARGDLRRDITARLGRYPLVDVPTRWMSNAEADTVLAALTPVGPVPIGGDLAWASGAEGVVRGLSVDVHRTGRYRRARFDIESTTTE